MPAETPRSLPSPAPAPTSPTTTLRVSIDRIVVHGVAPRDAGRFQTALQEHLRSLVAESRGQTTPTTAATEHLDLGTLPLRPRASEAEVGRTIAERLHGGLFP